MLTCDTDGKMDRLKRKYILLGSEDTEIPARTKRWKLRKALIEANNIEIHQSVQDLPAAHDSPGVWSPLSGQSTQSLSGTTDEVNVTYDNSEDWSPLSKQQSLSGVEVSNLNHNSSECDSDSGSEDAHSGGYVSKTADELSEAWTPISGQCCLSGEEASILQADCGDSMSRYPTSPLLFEDECSMECDLHFSDRPNSSPLSESLSDFNPDDLDDSVGMSMLEPMQSFIESDSESILGSGEQFSPVYESSPNESVNEGEDSNEKFPQLNEEPLYTGSRLTKAQSFLLIMSFVLRHALTGVALSDLLDLINIHCPENIMSTSKHLFLKVLKPIQGHLQCHIYCPNCEYYIGDKVSEGQCTVCSTMWDKDSSLKNGNFFIYLPIQTQLEHHLQRQDIACCLKLGNDTFSSENYDDICSGKLYHNLNKEGGPLDGPHGYSLTLNCDGVPVFKSSL
ncbi:uncharacterized protein LOC143526043 [Brachyhypopomus gauderio]|uniref:uncharacterized protein LOC143526043 n=1 Tax=Brachyhypopomus gauderio TaxID=698409 RepID=UPI00404206E5